MTTQFHCPYRQATLLQQALSPDKMKVAFMLGAGCPLSIRIPIGAETQPLIPDIRGLTKLVTAELKNSKECKEDYEKLMQRFSGATAASSTIEDILSHIRALQNVVRDGEIDGLRTDSLSKIDAEICEITTRVVGVELPECVTPYHQLATWVGGIHRAHPVEIFTPNYDLLVEQALETHKIPYFDGFVGSRKAFFDLTSMENETLPSRWARLWKVHGSINWWRTTSEEVVRCDAGATDGRQMIYPSHLKYDQSRRMPYLAMLDRLRAFLAHGQAVLIVCGYSFADQHLNEVILHGLRSNPNAVCFGLVFGARLLYPEALKMARLQPNLSVLAEDGAILGTVERNWRSDEQASHPLHGIGVAKRGAMPGEGGIEINCQFLLGDFKQFGQFLAHQLSRADEDQGSRNAT